MKKTVLKITVASLALFLVLAIAGNAFAAETAHRRGRGYYLPPPPPVHHYYHGSYGHGHHHGHYHHHVKPYYRPHYYGPRPVIVRPGVYWSTPRAAVGIYF